MQIKIRVRRNIQVKSKKVQKVLAFTLAATMMLASAVTVSASSGGSAGVTGSAGSAGAVESTESAGSSESSDGGSGSVEETVETFVSGAKLAVGGRTLQTTVAGAYAAKSVAGAAVTAPLAELKASLGLTGSQTPYIMLFDTDPKKSNLAMSCVNAAVDALGGSLVTTLNVDLGAKENGKRVALSNGSTGLVIGLPKNANTSKTYSVVCVQPGGVVTILQDQDSSPATVTFEIKAGLGTYGIVAK